MRAVIGLGNPGKKYEFTRHNVGFYIIDKIAEKYNLSIKSSAFYYQYAEGQLEDSSKFMIVKPTTFMNMSGLAVKDLLNTHNLKPEDILVIFDDLNIEAGRIKIRKCGGDGGHNGIRSIISSLNTDQFPRVRFGIGNRFEKGRMIDYVLSEFSDKELLLIAPQVSKTIDVAEKFISSGIQPMLDYYSRISNPDNNPLI
ncbi:MAG: aminoacyl-tRNA hydrolase [Melioribacteraceae bacterium]|nr:aminoacyl-tRNA hydrolase [Melioribacteraceae bacterium]